MLGTYMITVRDVADNACVTTCLVTVTEPELLECSLLKTDANCNTGKDGTILTLATGGSEPYRYSLNGAPLQISSLFIDVPSGLNEVTVRDANGCETTCEITVPFAGCVFDLALEKTFLNSSDTPIIPGSTVSFNIEVFNQGLLDAYNIELVDYIPEGLILTRYGLGRIDNRSGFT